MAEYKSGSLDSKTLAEKKSKRLEEALSAFTPEQTKETVSKLLEEYVDESGKNYFGAGTRDTTLYFADDEYIKEIEKEKNKSSKRENSKNEKKSVANKLHKLASIMPKSEHNEDKEIEHKLAEETKIERDLPHLNENEGADENNSENKIDKDVESHKPTFEKEDEINSAEKTDSDEKKEKMQEELQETVGGAAAEPEPTIVITPVKTKDKKDETPVKEDKTEMRRG
ncbi:MAG: hypothetical protein Q4F63_04355 [Clostridia bacterium]|nr:hypothetical protein [Clostridia bacterium]